MKFSSTGQMRSRMAHSVIFIGEAQAKLKELEAMKEEQKFKKSMKPKLTKESQGISELLNQLDAVAKTNEVKPAEVIILLARTKRTGLKFSVK